MRDACAKRSTSSGYVRNDVGSVAMRAGRSRSIALVVLDVGNPFFAAVDRGAGDRAAQEGMVVLLGSSGQDIEREDAYLEQFREQRVAGVLITPSHPRMDAITRLVSSGIPVVLVDSESSNPRSALSRLMTWRAGILRSRTFLLAGVDTSPS